MQAKRKKVQKPIPPQWESGEWVGHYDRCDPEVTVTLDYGTFLYMWEWIYRNDIVTARREYLDDEVLNVAHRAAEAFATASPQIGTVTTKAGARDKTTTRKKR